MSHIPESVLSVHAAGGMVVVVVLMVVVVVAAAAAAAAVTAAGLVDWDGGEVGTWNALESNP